jgi:hypothetical protein
MYAEIPTSALLAARSMPGRGVDIMGSCRLDVVVGNKVQSLLFEVKDFKIKVWGSRIVAQGMQLMRVNTSTGVGHVMQTVVSGLARSVGGHSSVPR